MDRTDHGRRAQARLTWVLAAAWQLAGCTPPPAGPPARPVAADAGAAAAVGGFPAALQALGTEPFWSVRLDGSQLTYTSPELPAGITVELDSRQQSGPGLQAAARLDGQPVRLTLGPGPCSDGMSDTVYPWTAQWQHGGIQLRGCARPHPPPR